MIYNKEVVNSNTSTSHVAFCYSCSSKVDKQLWNFCFLAVSFWQLWCILLRGIGLICSKWGGWDGFQSHWSDFCFFVFFPLFITVILSVPHKMTMRNACPCCNQPVLSRACFSEITYCWQALALPVFYMLKSRFIFLCLCQTFKIKNLHN